MLREKTAHMILLDRIYLYSLPLKPPAKMLNRLNVTMNRITRVSAVVQIAHENVENYGEMAGCHPVTRKHTLEVFLDHGNRRKGTAFSTYRHYSSYSFPSQIKEENNKFAILDNLNSA